MADQKLTDLPELMSIENNDFVYVVDVSDTTDSPEGTSKKIQKTNLDASISSESIIVQVPKRISFSTLNTWYSHYQLSNTSWIEGNWTRTSGTGVEPSRVLTNYQNTGALFVENKTALTSLDLYIRTAAAFGDFEILVRSYDYSDDDGNEINEQTLVSQVFNISGTSQRSYKTSFTINPHTLSADSIIQVFMRHVSGAGTNLDNMFLTYKFS